MSRDWKQIAQTEKKLAEHWEAQYATEKERADRAIQERKQFNQVYEMLLKKFKETDARELKLKEALNKVYFDDFQSPQERRDYIDKVVISLYPKEEEAK